MTALEKRGAERQAPPLATLSLRAARRRFPSSPTSRRIRGGARPFRRDRCRAERDRRAPSAPARRQPTDAREHGEEEASRGGCCNRFRGAPCGTWMDIDRACGILSCDGCGLRPNQATTHLWAARREGEYRARSPARGGSAWIVAAEPPTPRVARSARLGQARSAPARLGSRTKLSDRLGVPARVGLSQIDDFNLYTLCPAILTFPAGSGLCGLGRTAPATALGHSDCLMDQFPQAVTAWDLQPPTLDELRDAAIVARHRVKRARQMCPAPTCGGIPACFPAR